MIIGAAKCATTSVYDLLRAHPGVFMSEPKEPHYFAIEDHEEFLSRRGWYESLFSGGGHAVAVGEASVSSTNPTRLEIAPPRIRELLPDCRLIYMVRHPIRRIESDWRMMRYERRASGSIKKALEESPALLDWGFYWRSLEAYRALFPDEQILVVFFEDFVRDPRQELRRICAHIGADPSFDFEAADPNRARLASKDLGHYGRVASILKDTLAVRALKPLLPAKAIQWAKRMLVRQETFEVEWEPSIRREVVELYAEDTAKLLEHCGKPTDFWVLDH